MIPLLKNLYLVDEQTSYPLSPLVQLGAGERLGRGALAVEQGEEDVVGGGLRPPAEDLGYELKRERFELS